MSTTIETHDRQPAQTMLTEDVASMRLPHFPITLFAMVMGLTGLAIALEKVYHLFGGSPLFFQSLLVATTLLFITLTVLYGLKWWHHPDVVVSDFFHPIRMHFFPTVSISLLLLSIGYYSYLPMLAIPLWFIGATLHALFTFYIFSYWIKRNFEIQHANPAWFIPIVGNVIIPIVGVDLVGSTIATFFFVVGIFFWIILLTIVLYRIVFHHQLADKFIPTLFIFIAPPAVGFISYLRIAHNFDLMAHFLLFIGYFFTILLLFMVNSFWRLKFFVSWWAFTFPLDAITIASLVAYQITREPFYAVVSIGLLSITITVISLVFVETLQQVRRRTICVQEG
ncbi:SLAC1 anion channel family protein [Thiospirillum jenense]|uniref:C4-dicarboxylate ABC transporter n=1 Tax=Thiospirillum jenense TaxID=1653858 RepID=A0A839H770_9GAMM|nr:SLAC1 anion channel family protein [Thiospirillum jenense]MBB1125104.1 C4-dicarboxylate ABC transporter [Thiospirillum jenense]